MRAEFKALDLGRAATAIESASDRQEILDLLLRGVRSRAQFAALLSVHADHIRGRQALAEDGHDCSGIDALRIPRHAVAAFEEAIASGAATVATLASGEPFVDGFLEVLGGAARPAAVLPIRIATRTVALVVAHRGADGALTATQLADIETLLAASSEALARLLTHRSRAARTSDAPMTRELATTEGYEIEVTVDSVATKRAQLAAHRRNLAWPNAAEAIRDLIRDGMEHGVPDEDEQLELLLELGRIEDDDLGRPERALEAWRSAQTIDAGDPRVLDAMQHFFVKHERWLDCIELLERRSVLADDDRRRIAIQLEIAQIAREHLDDAARAIGAYEKVLELDPVSEVASRELGKLYTTRQQWEPLAALLLDRATRHEAVKPLELVARIYEDRIEDSRAAFLVWLSVVRREPARGELLADLDRLARAADAWPELIGETRALAEEVATKHPVHAAALWRLVGGWLRDRVSNRDESLIAFQHAARLDPTEADALDDLLRTDERWVDLIDLQFSRVQAEHDPKRRSELHAELGELYENKLGQPGEAIVWYERALADDPHSTAALVGLHRLHLAEQAWDTLAELLPRLLECLGPDTPRAVLVDLWVELGTILAEHLGRSDEAVDAFREALALDPKRSDAYRGLASIYEASGQTEALLETSEAEVDATSPADQQQRYADIAGAWHEYARLDRAAACWHKVLSLDARNLFAHKGLARVLRDDEQWAALAVAQRAHLRLVNEPFERVALLLEHAELLEHQFDNVEGTIGIYHEVLGLDARNRAALDALGRLHDRAGQWQPALDMLQRLLAEVGDDRKERGDVLRRIGQVHLGARDVEQAHRMFSEALSLDDRNAPAHEGAARVLLQQGKLVAAADELLRASKLSPTLAETVRLLVDAAWVYRYRLGDNEHARTCLQRILELDPDHVDAKRALAELLHDTQEWEALWPHLSSEAARMRSDTTLPPAERLAVLGKAARCALELSNATAALDLYDAACALDSGPVTELERAEALYRTQQLDAAVASFQAIATRHASSLERAQLFGVYRRLAGIHAELGNVPQAVSFHRKALDIDPRHRASLEDVAALNVTRGQFDDAIADLRSLAEVAPGAADRVAVLERIGNLYRVKLANPARAMASYLAALEIDHANHRVLQRVLDLQSETGQWKSAVETIERFLELESDRSRRGAYHIASAEIRRTHLKDVPGALECYETALDEMLGEKPLRPATRERALEAFHALRDLVAADGNWKYLEQCYRRMVKRLPKDDPGHVGLWDALGEIYRTQLAHPQSAIEAFELAHALDPDKSPRRTRTLAELYTQTGASRPQQASARVARLVEIDPMNADSYRALGTAAVAAGRTDEAWCVSRALVFLDRANTEEKALYRRFQRHETRKAHGILDEDAWGFLRHADEDLAISSIFALVWQPIAALRAATAKAFELKPKERLDVEGGTGVVAKIFKHAARVLNVPLPDVYVQPRRSGRLLLANCIEKGRLAPAVIVGRDLMTGYRDTEIAASVGAMLALLRPTYYLKLTLPTVEELDVALGAAIRVVGRTPPARPELESAVASLAADLQKSLTRSTGEALRQLVDRLRTPVDLARWRNAVDAGAQRAGLVIAGDLAAATRMIASEAPSMGAARPSQRVQELVAYSVSPAYFALRTHLGVAVA